MNRMLKVNAMLQQTIAQILAENIEVPFEFLITVTHIKCGSDLKTATVFISVLPVDKSSEALAFLINSRHEIQHLLGENIHLKFTPKLKFRIDDSEEKTAAIYQTIDNL